MNWNDCQSYIKINPPKEFNFEECLVYLGRSNQEVLHEIKEGSLYKLIKVNERLILFKLEYINHYIKVEFLNDIPNKNDREEVAKYIWEWFDLNTNLNEFYALANHENLLKGITHKYYGLRMISIHDLFETIVWAILGQQINLTFAYTLKRRIVERYGESLIINGDTYWLFPSYEEIAILNVDDLRQLQITMKKAEYIIGIAKAMKTGELSKEIIVEQQDYQEVKKSLIQFRGIGAWTADYVMMKCLHYTNSFPIADVGLHNAIKQLLGYDRKPTIEELEELSARWEGWQGYATFYLWRSLYD
ncbi:DNA-3-methyladenine glycosylase II [Bacillus mesophilus]|uniref:DNA-3-methyladenine glycosylase II n=1 Tax=Bacillus mesophilus TaxID=1808955 RepID=A0A6M0Q9P7_9BACI|nr:DNA-3-methyladenine glycosylase 2 [Bacillus mesophilus]MBM7662294.1 DNA-3-methyladenine glycosylase II [Bacillus mesophilus]NEY73072.1 DNA glycosylase [Bacillus mesophilus]